MCDARCLARRELFESWSFVAKVRPHLDAPAVWDLGAGHGLVAMLLAILEPDLREVRAVDRRKPPSFDKLRAALDPIAPDRLARVVYDERRLDALEPPPERVFVTAVHACGRRTDEAIDLALAARSSVALLPCCHDASVHAFPGALAGRWSKRDAVDLARIFRLDAAGYRTYSRRIEDGLTHCADAIIGVAPPGATGSAA
ncbi:MAG TPA: methyltransferase [Planctomycetota bacterium]|nr:methyltransferase [Planctomycetota bacterium]